MRNQAWAAAILGLATGGAQAGGLDRSGTPVEIIFEQGNYAEVSFGYTEPDLTGVDVLGNSYANVGNSFGLAGAGLKMDFGERLSFALIYDQPYGADVRYGGNRATTMLGGTMADAESNALTALLRYDVTDRLSVYGGPRVLQAEGEITLSGLAYGASSGYNVDFASDNGVGLVAGTAYEIPDIAFRAALTYHSAVDLDFRTTDNTVFPAATTSTEAPQSVKLAVQSGVAKDTLVFGSVRWSEWEAFTLNPPNPGVPNLAELDNATTWELGVGRRFTDRLSGSLAVTYEDGSDPLVSPLSPTNGLTAVTLGGEYQVTEKVTLSGGIRYTWLGDARPETGTPDKPRGTFTDNTALSAGMKLGVNF